MHWNPAVGIPLLILGLIVLALIWLFGRPRTPGQGRRMPTHDRDNRHEPVLGSDVDDVPVPEMESMSPRQGELDVDMREELERLGATLAGERAAAHAAADPVAAPAVAPAATSRLGKRPADQPVERIVSLFVVAREGRRFHGPDLVVAMEKAGLEFGAMRIFHRLLDGKQEMGAVFSVANMLKPGSFDMSKLDDLETAGLSFFMTLPGPLSALDAWDTMLPTAQRLAKLLDGQVLDEERNALGHQRIAYIRDDLRSWDRRREA
ncbi:MAG TPA: cell division protein ZipA [Rhodanobacteraceae bacterium]